MDMDCGERSTEDLEFFFPYYQDIKLDGELGHLGRNSIRSGMSELGTNPDFWGLDKVFPELGIEGMVHHRGTETRRGCSGLVMVRGFIASNLSIHR